MPMGVKAEDYADVLASVFRLTNIRGALVTMPHKITTHVAGRRGDARPRRSRAPATRSCKRPDGTLAGRPVRRRRLRARRAAQGPRARRRARAGVGQRRRRLGDRRLAGRGRRRASWRFSTPATASAEALAGRLRAHYPKLEVTTGSSDPAGFDVVVNATPLGMKEDDPLPFDVERIAPSTFVGEVVMKSRIHAAAAGRARQGLRGPGRHRHAVRDDPCLSRILRLRHRHAGRTAGRGEARLLTDTPMSIFEGFLSTSETLAAFSDRNFVDAMLRFEAALARAQAADRADSRIGGAFDRRQLQGRAVRRRQDRARQRPRRQRRDPAGQEPEGGRGRVQRRGGAPSCISAAPART